MDKKEEIRRLRSEGKSYLAIGQLLGLDKSYVWRVCNNKEGLKPRRRIADEQPALSEAEVARRFHALDTGAITEALVIAKLAVLGFEVWRPFVDRKRADLGVLVGSRLLRIQVKTAGYDAKKKCFRAGLCTRDTKRQIVRYSPADVDFFIAKCAGLEEYYVFPISINRYTTTVNLYPTRDRLLEKGSGFEEYRNAFHLLRQVAEQTDAQGGRS